MKFKSSLLPGALLAASALVSHAADFTPGNLLVYRVGANAGSASLTSAGNPVFVDEWTTTGTLVQSIATGIFASGTATSEGALSRSPDGRYVTFTGYASAATSLASTTSVAVNRTVSVVGANGTITTAAFSDFSSGNNPRAAATVNGTDVWMVGGTGGVRTGTISGGTSSSVSTTVANLRSIAAFDGQLYVSTSSGSAVRIGTVGTGTPTASGQTTANLPGFPTSGSPYEFVLADLDAGVAGVDTLYYTEDTTSGGFIGKYSLVGGTWVSNGTITAAAVRGLTASISGTTVSLYASTGGSAAAGGGTVYSFVDATGYNSTVSGTATSIFTNATLQTALSGAGSNYAFRGIEMVPVSVSAVPEPSTYAAFAGLAGLALAAWRRRRA